MGDIVAKNRLYVARQTDDIAYVVTYAGENNLVISSDCGHQEALSEIEALRHLRSMEDLEDGVVGRILDANPSALYGLSR